MAAETKETKTKAQRAQEYKQKYEALMEEAKEEQLEIIKAAIAELATWGFTYTVHEGTSAPASGNKSTGRPKGYKMSEEQKQRMRDGRKKAAEARAKGEAAKA